MATENSPTTTPTPGPGAGIHRKYRGCSKIGDYEVLGKLGEGTFGEVHKARSRKNGCIYALKKILMHNEKDGFPITALREIKLLKMLSHDNVLKLEEMAVERPKGEGRKRAVLYMVTPYMDHDLSGLLDNPHVSFTEPQIKCYMLQLLEGLRYLHDNHILHRDMKAANLLINNRGILQIADFGLARHYDEPTPQPGKGNGEARRDYTSLVVTRWYRPPELLLQLRRYTPAIDMWGAGCVFGEMFKRKPILTGKTDLNQAQLIFELVGSPNDETMPGWRELPGCDGVKNFGDKRGNLPQAFRELGSSAISLLSELLKLDWRKRINAYDALRHPYFRQHPLPAKPEELPTFQSSHELDRRNARHNAPPPAPAGGTVGMGPNGEWIGSGPQGPPGPPGGVPPWQNGDRRGGSRGPPPPPRGYDRGGPPGGPNYPPPGARWPGDNPNYRSGYRAPPGGGQSLPPPPGEGRHQLPRPPGRRVGREGGDRDTYIPSYRQEGERGVPRDRLSAEPGVSMERRSSRDSRDSREGGAGAGRDRAPGRRDYRDRDRDRTADRLDYGDSYDHHSHHYPPRRRTRSRSPGRERERERGDRDGYRARDGPPRERADAYGRR